MDWAKATARRDENHLSLGNWCVLYYRFYGTHQCQSILTTVVADHEPSWLPVAHDRRETPGADGIESWSAPWTVSWWHRYTICTCFCSVFIPPGSAKLKGGYTGFNLSVCPSVDRIVSALYLQQYSSDPFYICTSYKATSEGVSRVKFVSRLKNWKFWQILKICNFVCFWFGNQYDPIVWVIVRRRGYPQNADVLVVLVCS